MTVVNKLLAIPWLALLLAIIVVDLASAKAVDLNWHQWKTKHAKQYTDVGEEQKRRDIWQSQVDEVSQHNLRFEMGLETYKKGLNHFSDLTWDELESTYLQSLDLSQAEQVTADAPGPIDVEALPETVDWRDKGYVTDIKNQGQCGSCWAFSTAATLEGQLANKTKKKAFSLSPQQLVDCDKNNAGCNGGFPATALQYTQQNGIESWDDYTYAGVAQQCKYKTEKVVFKNTGMLYIYDAGELQLAQMVANRGPVSIGIQVTSDFFNYQSGVYTTDQCTPGHANHAVLAVGYGGGNCELQGTPESKDYWLVKNSWGPYWGDHGYIKMARNQDDLCSIALTPVVPLI